MPVDFVLLGIGGHIYLDEIYGIASSEDFVFHTSSYGSVQDLTIEIADKICATSKTRK